MVVAKSVWSYQLGDAYVPMPDQASDGLEELYMQWEKKHAPGQHEVSSGKYKYAVNFSLVAPYCALPRDYLSDTPLLRAMGFLVSRHGQ